MVRTKNTEGGILLNNTFTYKDTVTILGIGALIFIIAMLGSLFLSGISIFFVGLSMVSFGNRVKDLNKKLIEIDRVNKEVNDGKK